MTEVKAIFFLPVKDNDGRDLAEEIEDLISRICERFSGWTFEGCVSGAFRMADGSQKLDVCEKYMVLLDRSRIGELKGLLQQFKEKTLQESIYLEVQHHVD